MEKKTLEEANIHKIEEGLVQEAKSGNREAFCKLVNMYENRIYNLAFRLTGNRVDADDIFQETFLKAWTNIVSFKFKSAFSTWLHSIALNVFRSKWRKNLSHDSVSVDPVQMADFPSSSSSPEKMSEQKELNEQVQKAISELPEKYREVIVLYHIQNLDYAEIAKVLNILDGTMKARLHRAREMLKSKLINILQHFEV